MQETELKASDLIGYRVQAVDGEAGAVRDLVVDSLVWQIRYLAVGADEWAPGHEVLVAPRSLGGSDEQRRELEAALTVDQIRDSPSLAAGTPVVRDFEENWYRHYGWEEYWEAEVDVESKPEPPIPPAPPAEEPLPAEANADEPGLLRLENLTLWRVMTTDHVPLVVYDLLIDDSDWRIGYFELEIDNTPVRERCLVEQELIVGADPAVERLYLSVAADALRQAPRRPHPGAGEDCEVRTLAGTAAG